MKLFMTSRAKTCAVLNIKSVFWICSVRLYMMSGEFLAFLVAFLTSVIVLFKNRQTPVFVLFPKSFLLYALILAIVIPMRFAFEYRHHFVFTFNRAGMFFSVWLIPNFFSTNKTRKGNSANTKIYRGFTKVLLSVFLFSLIRPFNSFVPYCRNAFAKMGCTKSFYPVFFQIISNSSTANGECFCYLIWAYFFPKIKIFKGFFVWFHRLKYTHKFSKKQVFCTATNTWKRIAIATW